MEEDVATIAGRKTYEAYCYGTVGLPDWHALTDQERTRWVTIAQTAARASPAPVVLEVSYRHPHGVPYKGVFYADTTKESIARLARNLEQWLAEAVGAAVPK